MSSLMTVICVRLYFLLVLGVGIGPRSDWREKKNTSITWTRRVHHPAQWTFSSDCISLSHRYLKTLQGFDMNAHLMNLLRANSTLTVHFVCCGLQPTVTTVLFAKIIYQPGHIWSLPPEGYYIYFSNSPHRHNYVDIWPPNSFWNCLEQNPWWSIIKFLPP